VRMSDDSMKYWNPTAVRCLAGYKANERPISFLMGEHEIEVRTVLKSWREPDHTYFKIETEDRRVYQLRCNEHEGSWEVRELAPGRRD
jgi:hypothetical protein